MTREWKAILFSQVYRKLEALVASWKWSHVILRYYKNTATPSGWRFLAPSELGTDWQSGQVKPREVTRQQCRCGRARGGIESERIGQRGIKGGGDRATWRVVFISKFSYCFFFSFFSFFPLFSHGRGQSLETSTRDWYFFFLFFEKRKIFREKYIRLHLNFLTSILTKRRESDDKI